MKNKTLRTNSMKLKKVIAASLAISVLFAFTGCGSSSSTNNTNTKQESSSTTETGSADELNEKLNDLYQQENQLFADHKDAWDKAFGLMNKNAAGNARINQIFPRHIDQQGKTKNRQKCPHALDHQFSYHLCHTDPPASRTATIARPTPDATASATTTASAIRATPEL